MESPDDLTPSQRRAVEHRDGPLLVLAGPGSGKTRVITRRIARIVETGVDPKRVLAITFTNKAAGEMAARIGRLLPDARVWVSTFHRFCARLLRTRAEAVGLKPNFTILDVDDQRRLVRDVLRRLKLDPVHFPPDRVRERISRAKNDLLTPESFGLARQERVGDAFDSVVVEAYPEYQRRLLQSNAVDFDDLLLWVVQILSEHPEIRRDLDARFEYILVDEYQDTNLAQYQIVAALSRDYPNLCVTGDPDQSIYGWRGARIENILRFESDYPNATLVRLEENFRSTKSILAAADQLIAHNRQRRAKTMRTDNPEGIPVEMVRYDTPQSEAQGIARAIREGLDAGTVRPADVAVFYRVNALSRTIEQAFARHRIPYQVASGFAFFERAEIKDLLAYLRLIANPQDRPAFLRAVNVPPRGIGKKSLQTLLEWADVRQLPLLDAAQRADEVKGISGRAAKGLREFAGLLAQIAGERHASVRTILERVLERSSYAKQWEGSNLEEDQDHLANVNELVTAASEYDSNTGDPSLEGFLESSSLVSDVDNVEGDADRVTLMTLHSAKGLEFPVVYIIGVERGFIPHDRSLGSNDPGEYEEERRLLFVGMTRSQRQLVLTRAQSRGSRGRLLDTIPSEFVREIGLVEKVVESPRTAIDEHDHQDFDSDHPDEDQSGPDEDDQAALSRRRPPAGQQRDAHHGLMTGADLLAGGGARSTEIPMGFAVGMSVRHPRYGVGRVVKLGGFARNRVITVEFEDDGRTESFVAGKNPLQPVGTG